MLSLRTHILDLFYNFAQKIMFSSHIKIKSFLETNLTYWKFSPVIGLPLILMLKSEVQEILSKSVNPFEM